MNKLIKNNIILIKKSKFLTFLYEIDNLEEIKEILNNLKIEHKKATHICYAYKIGVNAKYFDDGEPAGTAGKPIFNVIEKKNLNNVLIIVIRYFGGIKLGAGGLFRAYSNCASEILK